MGPAAEGRSADESESWRGCGLCPGFGDGDTENVGCVGLKRNESTFTLEKKVAFLSTSSRANEDAGNKEEKRREPNDATGKSPLAGKAEKVRERMGEITHWLVSFGGNVYVAMRQV